MALSNIFREPRREITETVVGIVLPIFYLASLSLWGSSEFAGGDRLCKFGCDSRFWYLVVFDIFFGLCGLVGMVAIALALVGIHALGEKICDALENQDIHLRPRQRH